MFAITGVDGFEAAQAPLAPGMPILVGVSNVQSGPSSLLGKRLLAGSEAYFDRVNRQGGIYGHPIRLIVKDDRYEPDPAVKNTNELITKDHCFFLFDYVGTATLTRVLPLLKFYEAEHVINVAPFTGSDPQHTAPYDKYVFSIRASYRGEARVLVKFLHAKGYRRIGFLGQADAYGKNGEIAVREALAAFGLSLVESVTYRRNQPDSSGMRAQVQLLRAARADAVIVVGVYGPCAAFIRDARLSGWNVPIANVSFVGPESLLTTLEEESQRAGRDLATNLYTSQVVPSVHALELPMVADYCHTVPPAERGPTSLEGWLNAVVVTEALRRSGPELTRLNLIHGLESLGDWDPGLGRTFGFSPTDHQGLSHVWLTKAEGGHWLPVEGSWEQP
ncbi:MAG TPA: ABC transporter substrate-binding protein [Bryobacteraceae bacterium]|nr:ABC transporter substrate-binding protein [Bryobacteraceae bacterium]